MTGAKILDYFEDAYKKCRLCPRNCGINREAGELGVCEATATVTIASYNLHFGEEPPISGTRGSGTIFFGNCSLRCVFCQNYPISQLHKALREVSREELADLMLNLQQRGAHNINLVTPTHYAPSIVESVLTARKRGLSIPIAYNTSGYEKVEVLKMLEDIVDIYMPDFKYSDETAALKYSGAKDYPSIAADAIKEMYRQKGDLQIDEDGIAKKGVLIRHLILPGLTENSMGVLNTIKEQIGTGVHISLMNQYFPAYKAFDEQINRIVTEQEYKKVYEYLLKSGFSRGYAQEEGIDDY